MARDRFVRLQLLVLAFVTAACATALDGFAGGGFWAGSDTWQLHAVCAPPSTRRIKAEATVHAAELLLNFSLNALTAS